MTIISFSGLTFEEVVAKQRRYNLDYNYFYDQLKRGYAPLNIDCDNIKQARIALRKLKKSKYSKNRYQILWRKSCSRRGYHFIVFKDGKLLFLPIGKVLKLRRSFHDCIGRLNCDIKRAKKGLAVSILFNSKNGRYATAWRDLTQLKL